MQKIQLNGYQLLFEGYLFISAFARKSKEVKNEHAYGYFTSI